MGKGQNKNIDIKEKQILEEGFDSVSESGVNSFTVEGLASKLFISKKTIYEYFPSKEKLLEKIVKYRIGVVKSNIDKIVNKNPNPVLQFIEMKRYLFKFTSRFDSNKMVEFKSKYPHIWKMIESMRLENRHNFLKILSKGQKQGDVRKELDINLKHVDLGGGFYFQYKEDDPNFKIEDIRKELDINFVSTLYVSIINSTFQPEFFINNNISYSDSLQVYTNIMSYGLFTKKGLEILQDKKFI